MIKVNFQHKPQFADVLLTESDLKKIGAKAINLIHGRVAQGNNNMDRKMKRLSPSYAARKRRLGQPGIRNLMFSGAMLGGMTIVGSSATNVTIGWTRRELLIRAQANQDRASWFGMSPRDDYMLQQYVDRLLKSKLSQ